MKRRIPTHLKYLGLIIGMIGAIGFSFTNCSKVAFEQMEAPSEVVNNAPLEPQYATLKAGDAANFPPLKLIFVVDNSGTMGTNQINLSSAFSKLFEGDNATNLTPFESSAYLFNTSQKSILESEAVFSKLPQKDLMYFSQFSLSDINSGPRAPILNGQIPGDLVGYSISKNTVDGLDSLSYKPAPVAMFETIGGNVTPTVSIKKQRGAAVGDFAQAFRDRIAVLDPKRSAIDPATNSGILDPVVDNESGLCALARVMKHNTGIVEPGDAAAFIVVSDEDDADPSGVNCLDSVNDVRGTDDLVDVRCDQPRTELTFEESITSSAPKCTVKYETGFSFKYVYNQAQTPVNYWVNKYKYALKRTNVQFQKALRSYSIPQVKITYEKKAPTYQVPRTTITYYKVVEDCLMRDGNKINCTYTYPKFTPVVDGDFKGNCATFVNGKIPTDALKGNAQYPISCQAATPRDVAGACSPTDTDKINCNQNYSAAGSKTVNGPVAGTCSDWAKNQGLPSEAIYDAGHEPKCDASVAPIVKTNEEGFCGTIAGCTPSKMAATQIVDGIPGSKTCEAFAKDSKKLPASAIYADASSPISCPLTTNSAEKTADGLCPSPANANHAYCNAAPTKVTDPKILSGVPGGQSCSAFASGKLPSNAIYDSSGTYALVCQAPTSSPVELASSGSSITYGANVLAGYAPKVNTTCSQALVDLVKNRDGVPSPTSCTITAVSSGSYAYDNKTCAEVASSVSNYCQSSNGTKRNCDSGTNTPAGPSTRMATNAQDGTFTCDTLCSATGFCKMKAGTVGDNYPKCSVKALSDVQGTVMNAELASNLNQCATGKKRVVVKGPYRSLTNDVKRYVAGSASETATPNALSNYIRTRSQDIFGQTNPSVSVFVHQDNSNLGQKGSVGKAYNDFANMMGGQKRPVLSTADQYATSLQSLGGMIREKLERSFKVPGVRVGQAVRRVWHKKSGSNEMVLLDQSNWTSSGGTVTLDANYAFEFGDEFKFEYF